MKSKLIPFLRSCKRVAASSPGAAPLTYVMGNEACDMDSMISSIFLSYSLSAQSSPTHIPLINIPREDFPLRNDAQTLFAVSGLDPADLVFADEVNLHSLATQEVPVRIALVDHNKLADQQSFLAPLVSKIFDHHADEKKYLENTSQDRTIEAVGSCTTLIVENLLENGHADLLSDAHISNLLLSVILLDNYNFDPKLWRGTHKDIAAAQLLVSGEMGPSLAEISLEQVEDSIRKRWDEMYRLAYDARNDIGGLTIAQHLRRDYKQITCRSGDRIIPVGISSVPGRRISTWLDDSATNRELFIACEKFAKDRELQCLMVMCQFRDGGEMRRELMVAVEDSSSLKMVEDLCSFMAKSELHLEGCRDLGGKICGRLFEQKNTKCSRKQVIPLIEKFFQQ
eukprot:TRINITY_DN10371_c0_g1_i1.p1 TRINITY_DN10371_c0_g1~~TRINITY_DN10371_c0_g1_i1.p1  ORF type:complete len:397 (+),score=123.30 TRINITY_DN10371_c0_g1_i1:1-1191(+)